MAIDKGKRIAQLVQEACIREACAPKPGNVNRDFDFPETTFEDFLLSAVAVGPAFENAAASGVGRIVLHAVRESRCMVSSNTNLGMVLLLAPLAKACMAVEVPSGPGNVRKSLHAVLQSLTVEDARSVYSAIRLANPGGMGEVSRQDISGEPSETLLDTMRLAKERDAIASEYVTGFEITFDTGLPALKGALSCGAGFPEAIVQAFLEILSHVPDTLIARKNGMDTARKVSLMAGEVLDRGGMFFPEGREKLRELDNSLRDGSHRLNPGTTADLTAAAIFLALFEAETFQEA